MDYTYLVTGSDGHLGSWIVRKLIKKGKTVRGLRLPNSTLKTPIIENVFYGDITNKESLKDFFNLEKAKVIHTAGIINVTNKMTKKLYDVNVEGSINILELCKEHHFPLTYISSVHSFCARKGFVDEKSEINPQKVIGPYAITKATTTLIMEKERENIDINIVFPSGILGPKDYGHNHLNSVIEDRVNGKLYAYLEGGYDMVDVRDVASFVVKLATSKITNENYIITNKFISVKEFLDKIGYMIKDNKHLVKIPYNLAKILAPLSEAYYKIIKRPALFCSYSIFTLTHSPMFSHEKATFSLKYYPRKIDKTISDVIKDLKKPKLNK
ncbi:MAG: NAD-dependent epimerase/dehydratase family protein [Sphaerochaetaceae bacterium]|nr:NAD-dependent epimerase/dehydratase family protein [Sphaerochaetaceae bacterium]MDC7236681.1 NAD-dependent epimerase/dehydratase family protein [Sphaerochaetaceae bacterium]MDC7250253.1 NAD-dependent epimerase/dehydratase family protein [Sphaerochaetaceae bacterium]